MPVTFVHLSDIHFGQEKGAELVIHNDVKERLIEDAAALVRKHSGGKATGIIVSGDIAYAGKSKEYRDAAKWLDRLALAIDCPRTAVQVVPGNHDIDRGGISSGCKLMLEQIIEHGEPKLDSFLESELDREVLYGRFAAYRPFAEGYNCPLDRSGGIASDRSLELAPGRTLRFIGLNSALICAANDVKGRLLLGARQHVLPRNAAEELIVICHHPLDWLQDSEAARRYVRSRARVFVSGHEHDPSLRVEQVEADCDLMMLAAGATVPPKADNKFTYTYNLLTFDWDAGSDALKVTIVPRAWSDDKTDFDADDVRLGGREPVVVLGSPNFRKGRTGSPADASPVAGPGVEAATVNTEAESSAIDNRLGDEAMEDPFPMLLLRFFRDLSPTQRLAVLLQLKALPEEWRDPLTHHVERSVVDALVQSGRLPELEAAINKIQGENANSRGESQ